MLKEITVYYMSLHYYIYSYYIVIIKWVWFMWNHNDDYLAFSWPCNYARKYLSLTQKSFQNRIIYFFLFTHCHVEYHKTIDRPVFFYVTWFTASLSCMSMSRSYNSVTAADCINFLWNLSKPCKWTEKNGSRLAVGIRFLGKGQIVS